MDAVVRTMERSAIDQLRESVSQVSDPRVQGRSDHLLVDIVCITILGVLCGADDFVAVATFARKRREWLQQYFELPSGAPSHDTFGRVMGLIDPKQFSACLVNWTAELQTALKGRHVAIDGKTARGSVRKSKGLRAMHLVSAWAAEAGLTLGQVAVDEKSNEITAIPELLELLSLKGAIVTIDAMGMQKEIVEKINEKEADYVIGLKDNQPTLAADMRELVEEGCQTNFENLKTDVYTTAEKAHGGVEQRDIRAIEIPKDSPHRKTWKGLRTLAVVLMHIVRNGVETFETRLYLSSLAPNAKLLAKAIRGHWGIENSLHWTMDVTFNEDHHRLLDRNGVCNLSAIRRLAVSILRQDTKSKIGAKNKRFQAALDPNYLLEVLDNMKI
jgi:predicted transposase YbfD/YdcC